MNLKNLNFIAVLLLIGLFASCNNNHQIEHEETKPKVDNKGHELVLNMINKVGDYKQLREKNDVTYTYTYTTPNGEADVSTEKYLFDGEYSYGNYSKHERTLPQLEGGIEQGYDGNEFWLKHNGEVIQDEAMMKRVSFNRPTNFYWFTMMQKLADPGLNYEYLEKESREDSEYDIVRVTFVSQGEKPTDIYQLYINEETSIVDKFLFTVADFGAMTPKLMEVEYEEIEGMLIPTKRQYKNSTWNADITDEPWIKVAWTDIQFDTGLTSGDFKKENDMPEN